MSGCGYKAVAQFFIETKEIIHSVACSTRTDPSKRDYIALSDCFLGAYLLILGSSVYYISHERWQQLGHMVDTRSVCTIGSTRPSGLAGLACLVYPLSRYRVYNIEYAKLMCSRCFLEVCVDLLDKDGFGLGSRPHVSMGCVQLVGRDLLVQLTCTLALQSAVRLVILDPVTPGALSASIDWSIVSSSATQDDISAKCALPPAYCERVQCSCKGMIVIQARDNSMEV